MLISFLNVNEIPAKNKKNLNNYNSNNSLNHFRIMIVKLKVTSSKKLIVWIHHSEKMTKELPQLFKFFGDRISVKKRLRVHKSYKITSENPALMLSLHSTILDLIYEVYYIYISIWR